MYLGEHPECVRDFECNILEKSGPSIDASLELDVQKKAVHYLLVQDPCQWHGPIEEIPSSWARTEGHPYSPADVQVV